MFNPKINLKSYKNNNNFKTTNRMNPIQINCKINQLSLKNSKRHLEN